MYIQIPKKQSPFTEFYSQRIGQTKTMIEDIYLRLQAVARSNQSNMTVMIFLNTGMYMCVCVCVLTDHFNVA